MIVVSDNGSIYKIEPGDWLAAGENIPLRQSLITFRWTMAPECGKKPTP
jgi:hypothetical protein